MSKNNTASEKVKDIVVEPENKVKQAKEAIDTLRAQLQEHIRKEGYHRTMSNKAQGALEVLLQLYPEEDDNES